MPEYYAERVNADGTTVRYKTKSAYQMGVFQAMGTRAATRAKIARELGRL